MCGAKEILLVLELATGLVERPELPDPQPIMETSDYKQTFSWQRLRTAAKDLNTKADERETKQKRLVQFWELAENCLPQIQR